MSQSPKSDPSAEKGKPARPRRPRRWLRLIVILLVAALAGLVAFLLLKGPATPEPDRTVRQPDANSASLKDSERASLFDKFTFLQPASVVWATGTSNAPGTMTYRDVTSCNQDAASCSTISFVDLSNPDVKTYFGDSPLDKWAKDAGCKTGDQVLEGTEEFDTDGETTRYYRIPCGVEGELSVHAWFIPGKDLFVFTYSGEGGTLSVEIAKVVMDSVRWI